MPRPRSDIRLRLVHAARARFLTDGVDGASQRQIARDAKTNVGMVYYYFPTKDDLFLAVVEEVYARVLLEVQSTFEQVMPVADRIRKLFERFGRLNDDELDVLRIIVREMLVSTERRAKLIERFSRGHLPLALRMLGEGIASGEIRMVEHPFVMMMGMFAMGLAPQVIRRLAGPEFAERMALPDGESLARMSADVLLRGFEPR